MGGARAGGGISRRRRHRRAGINGPGWGTGGRRRPPFLLLRARDGTHGRAPCAGRRSASRRPRRDGAGAAPIPRRPSLASLTAGTSLLGGRPPRGSRQPHPPRVGEWEGRRGGGRTPPAPQWASGICSRAAGAAAARHANGGRPVNAGRGGGGTLAPPPPGLRDLRRVCGSSMRAGGHDAAGSRRSRRPCTHVRCSRGRRALGRASRDGAERAVRGAPARRARAGSVRSSAGGRGCLAAERGLATFGGRCAGGRGTIKAVRGMTIESWQSIGLGTA